MRRYIFAILGLFLLLLSSPLFVSASAATFFSGDDISLTEDRKNLSDIYVFGSNIRIETPITEDVVVAGGDIRISETISDDLLAAGGNIDVTSRVGGSIRIAGGNIVIDGPIERDLVVIGGTLTTTRNASIGGDLVFTGGKLRVVGPVRGNVVLNAGEVTLDSRIGGNVTGEVGKLLLSENAGVAGDLRYRSENRATISDRAVIRGETAYQRIERSEDAGRDIGRLVRAGTYYKLITDILLSFLFILLVPLFLTKTFQHMLSSPLNAGVTGFLALLIMPLISLFLLLIIWLGVLSFLFYFLLLLLAMVVANIFAGNYLLTWWYKRDGKPYHLDWKAAIVGPLVLYLLWLIPIIGWLAAFILYLVSLGGLLYYFLDFLESQKKK
jgi:hypothetical protein